MSKLVPKSVAGVIAVAVLCSVTPATQSKFTLKVHTGRGQVGYDVNSTMIIGERDMVVIDPQFWLSEAHKLAAEILESKKRLTTIYSTHPHPDHLFGFAVLKQAFPEARLVALPATVTRRRPAGRRGRSSGSRCTATTFPVPSRCCPRNSPRRC
jgi:glyoxylase-like metal-dependent hydrolase (beta-lactamase superfamily II)